MPSYTVHAPASGRESDKTDGAIFVSDGWSWPGFIFGPLWLAYYRQWFGLLGYVLLWLAITAFGKWLGLHMIAASLLSTLLNIAVALEGGQIRRWTLGRHAMPAVAVVSAPNREDAEIRYLAHYATNVGTSRALPMVPSTGPAWPARTHAVLGSFPEPGGR